MPKQVDVRQPTFRLAGSEAIVESVFIVDTRGLKFSEVAGGREPDGNPQHPRVILTEVKSGRTFTVAPARLGRIDLVKCFIELRIEALRGNVPDVFPLPQSGQNNLSLEAVNRRVTYQLTTSDDAREHEAWRGDSLPDGPLFPKMSTSSFPPTGSRQR